MHFKSTGKSGRTVINFFIAGPCALESFEQVEAVANLCQRWGIQYFRAQLFKPRTSPYSFQGLGEGGLPLIDYLKKRGLKIVSEACSIEQLEVVLPVADVLQIGARNMQNFELLKQVGQSASFQATLPHVMLKRGFGNTLKEWISSADYLIQSGVPREKIIMCERGTRNYCSPTGVTLDFGLAMTLKLKTDFKVIIDPSHGTRDSSLVLPLAKAALAMPFDGIMIEIHPRPQESLSDPFQAISLEAMEKFMQEINGSPRTPELPGQESYVGLSQ